MFRPLIPLLFAASILLGGNGVLNTLIALRGTIEGFDAPMIGLMGTCYFIGFAFASFRAAKLIRSIGHVRAFAALAAIGALAPLVMAMLPNAVVWLLARAVSGFCFAALLMVIESWINEISKNSSRGRILSVYRVVDLLAVTGTQFLIPLVGEAGYEIFSVVSMMYCLSLVPVSLSTRTKPNVPDNPKLELNTIWHISPLACITSLSIGLTNSAFRFVGAIYGIEIGLDTSSVIIFMTLGIAGGAVLQYPFGYISDMVDRRKTVLFVTIGAMFAAMFLSHQQGGSVTPIYIGVFIFGAFAFSLYSLAAAHANDRAKFGQYVLVSAGLNFFYSAGAVVGPYIASLVMKYHGAAAFFVYACVVHGALALTVMVRMKRRESVPQEQRSKFVGLLKTSPMFSRMAKRLSRPTDKPPNI